MYVHNVMFLIVWSCKYTVSEYQLIGVSRTVQNKQKDLLRPVLVNGLRNHVVFSRQQSKYTHKPN